MVNGEILIYIRLYMDVPVILVSCCDDSSPVDLIKTISDNNDLGDGVIKLESIKSYPWHIATKYYNADVQFCTTNYPTIGDQEFSENVEAIILSFDTKSSASYDIVKSWLPAIRVIDPEIRLLVCSRCKESDSVSRENVLLWCIDNQFELIELNPDVDGEDSDEDLVYGFRRVVSALQAHTWPNLILKERAHTLLTACYENDNEESDSNDVNSTDSNVNNVESLHIDSLHLSQTMNVPMTKVTKNIQNEERKALYDAERLYEVGQSSSDESCLEKLTKEEKMRKNEERKNNQGQINDDLLLNEASSIDAMFFEDVIFQKLQTMKDHSQRLPPDERKRYAEKVAITFWKSFMDDNDEIEGLSHSSDEDDK